MPVPSHLPAFVTVVVLPRAVAVPARPCFDSCFSTADQVALIGTNPLVLERVERRILFDLLKSISEPNGLGQHDSVGAVLLSPS